MSKHRGRHRCDREVTVFIRPHHVGEEDKKITDKELKQLCYLWIL